MLISLSRQHDNWVIIIDHEYNNGTCSRECDSAKAIRIIMEHMLEEGMAHGSESNLVDRLLATLAWRLGDARRESSIKTRTVAIPND